MTELYLNHDGSKTINIDGTGKKPSVDAAVAKNIINYIRLFFPDVINIVDLGAGVGHLQAYADIEKHVNVTSIEGYKNLNFVCDRSKLIIADLTKPMVDLFGKFDMAVSFECIEHIRESDQSNFWYNASQLAPLMLCSIHCMNEENDEHCFIRSSDWWENWFDITSFKRIDILGTPEKPWCITHRWECSITALIEF